MNSHSLELRSYIQDGHGHSRDQNHGSDGLSTAAKIVAAARRKLDIVSLTDHNVVSNLPRFLTEIDRINQSGIQMLGIGGIEYLTQDSDAFGEILITFPDRHEADNFICSFKKPSRKLWPLDVLELLDRYRHAIGVFAHPDMRYFAAIKRKHIETLLPHIPEYMRRRLGVEIHNWMSRGFFWERHHQEWELEKANHHWGLAAFYFTDYHHARHVGRASTRLLMKDLSSTSYVEAVTARRTFPYQRYRGGFREWCDLTGTSLISEIKTRYQWKKDFYIPDRVEVVQ